MIGQENGVEKMEFNSKEGFLSNPDVQTKAVKEYHIIIWDRYLKNYHAYEGQEIGGIKLTKSGMIACSHLGYSKLINFIDSNGKIDEADDFGTKCTKYLHELAGYDLDCLTIGYSKDLTVGDSQEVKEDL